MKLNIRSKKNMIIRLIFVAIVLYVGYLLVSPFVKMKIKQDEINKIEEQISVEKSKNQEILNKLEEKGCQEENSDAQDGGNSHSGARVYENVVR